ncbi:glycolate oxidase iron-sulfur subunit [Bacillus pakistanensis]|uniref:Glycolate oxidase iron-sulfur subunit n=1 Tax=Rossellomorea pakistanensis TaxID=992288 RepID=A0ABS2NHD4_9BACI|nr:(Fe-S)-binding protein [Bacillus pakistanensis]MBM7587228.1 glycolate oxidase iron-sulfur subunit [Bacillus pakistanensis]
MSKDDTLTNVLYKKTYDEVNQCIQCGYCLPACPTYKSMETESASPRGRINLVKMAAEGKIDLIEDLKVPIDLCLGCRACEIACPVDVPYGSILENAKEVIHDMEVHEKKNHAFKDFALNQLFTKPKSMKVSSDLYYLYQKSGLQKFVRSTNLSEKLVKNVGSFEKALPKVPAKKYQIKRGRLYEAKTENAVKTVALFLGCINDAVFYHVNYYTLELLRVSGCNVYVPEEQTCCGALHAHQGQMKQARQLAKENLTAFEEYAVDTIITNAGGCGAILQEYDHLLKDDTEWMMKAKKFTGKIKDISEVLSSLNSLPFTEKLDKVVTYQPSCHLSNVQKAGAFPEWLIQQIPGVKYIELPSKNSCCASGGIYNIQQYDESMKILGDKMDEVNIIKPDIVVTSNPGCLIQISHGINTYGEGQPESIHLVELLARSCGIYIQ